MGNLWDLPNHLGFPALSLHILFQPPAFLFEPSLQSCQEPVAETEMIFFEKRKLPKIKCSEFRESFFNFHMQYLFPVNMFFFTVSFEYFENILWRNYQPTSAEKNHADDDRFDLITTKATLAFHELYPIVRSRMQLVNFSLILSKEFFQD